MAAEFYAGMTDAMELGVLDQFNRLDRRRIFRHWVEEVKGLSGFCFESIYLGHDRDGRCYRFQCQEYKGEPEESHQFRLKNLNRGDSVVVIVQDAEEDRFHAVRLKLDDDGLLDQINGKTVTYGKLKNLAGEEDHFDIYPSGLHNERIPSERRL